MSENNQAPNSPVLDLDALEPKPFVLKFGGKEYEMRSPASFSAKEGLKLRRLGIQAQQLLTRLDDSNDASEELETAADQITKAADEMIRMAFPGFDDELLTKLDDAKKLRILNFIWEAMRALRLPTLQATLDTLLPASPTSTSSAPKSS